MPDAGIDTAAAIAGIASLFATAITSSAALLLWRWKFRGRVDTTDATALWAENAELRREYRRQIAELRAEMAAQDRHCADELKLVKDAHAAEIAELRVQLHRANETIGILGDELRLRAIATTVAAAKVPPASTEGAGGE